MQIEMRSADEAMTTFYKCCKMECGHRWRDWASSSSISLRFQKLTSIRLQSLYASLALPPFLCQKTKKTTTILHILFDCSSLQNCTIICWIMATMNHDTKQFGKQFLFDDDPKTCWNSAEGAPQCNFQHTVEGGICRPPLHPEELSWRWSFSRSFIHRTSTLCSTFLSLVIHVQQITRLSLKRAQTSLDGWLFISWILLAPVWDEEQMWYTLHFKYFCVTKSNFPPVASVLLHFWLCWYKKTQGGTAAYISELKTYECYVIKQIGSYVLIIFVVEVNMWQESCEKPTNYKFLVLQEHMYTCIVCIQGLH